MLRACDPRIGSLLADFELIAPPPGFCAAPPFEEVMAGMAHYQLGQAGAVIALLQQMLARACLIELAQSGLFEPATRNAVEQYQQRCGHAPNGMIDASLLIALMSSGLEERAFAAPMRTRRNVAPRVAQPRPEGAVSASDFLQADEARRRGAPASPRAPISSPVAPVEAPASGSTGSGSVGQRVLLLGDSHTVGSFGQSLERRLEADGRTVTREARVGASAATHLPNVAANIRAADPDTVVVALGANFRNASQAQIRSQVDRMVAAVKATGSDANIVWVGPPRWRADEADGGAALRRFDSMMATELERSGREHGVATRYVSSEPVTHYAGPDGHHYNRGPAEEWSGSIHDAITSGGERPTTTAPATTAPPATPPQDGAPTTGGVSAAELRQIAPNLTEARANELVPHLNRAMRDANITTQRQQAAFIAQLSAESGGFRWFEELASGDAYEGRAGLGNTEPGDGRRYKGRGPIQLTGRANYRAAGRALGLDLENNPEQVATPEVGFRVAAWFWNSRRLNDYAERGDFREVTRRINGGYNGLEARTRYYDRALSVLA